MIDAKKIIDDMRNITMLTGEISSLHIQNLQQWSFVAFDGVESVEIDYDLSKDTTQSAGEGFVYFNIDVEETAENDKLEERCKTLTSWVRDMFWPEIKVSVSFNGVSQYSNSTKEEENGLD